MLMLKEAESVSAVAELFAARPGRALNNSLDGAFSIGRKTQKIIEGYQIHN
jgi:hypothetical protein